MNSAALNVGVLEFLFSIFLSTYPEKDSGSYGNSIFNFLSNCLIAFTILRSQQQCTSVLISPHPCWYSSCVSVYIYIYIFLFLIRTNLASVKWYLIVVLICIFTCSFLQQKFILSSQGPSPGLSLQASRTACPTPSPPVRYIRVWWGEKMMQMQTGVSPCWHQWAGGRCVVLWDLWGWSGLPLFSVISGTY